MELFEKKGRVPSRRLMALAVLWDTGWRAAALRVALRRHEFGWVIPLGTVSSMGALPIFYLWRRRGQNARSAPTHGETGVYAD
jgi:hypothetical protein